MKNKSLILLMALLLGLSGLGEGCIISHANDNSQNSEEAMALIIKDANLYIAEHYGIQDYYPPYVEVGGIRHEPSFRIYRDYKLIGYYAEAEDLAMINPASEDRVIAKKGDRLNTAGTMIYRYVGYDAEGRRLNNPHFPPDSLGEKPDSSGLVDWGDSLNRDWARIIGDEDKIRAKEDIEANFKKSLISTLKFMIHHYFLYHIPDFPNTEEYYNTWLKFLEKLFSSDFSRNINVVLLPTTNANGLAVFKYKSGYYSAIYLKYQEKTEAILKICHIAVEEDAEGLIVSKGAHPINTQNDFRILKEGKRLSIRALQSEAYDCVGHSFHPNLDYKFKAPEAGSRPGSLVSSPEFNYAYKYEFHNDRPCLIFYYKKRPDMLVEDRRGKIVVSSPKFEVSRAVPTDENVKIEAYVDDAYLCEVLWGRVKQEIDIPVAVSGVLNSHSVEAITKEVDFHKLHQYRVYRLSRVLVQNPKLDAKKPIELYPEKRPRSEARAYSQNIMGLHLGARRLHVGKHSFEVEVKRVKDYEPDNETADTSTGINALIIELRLMNGGGEVYLSEAELRSLREKLEEEVRVELRNDFLSIGNRVISSDRLYHDKTPEPNKIESRPLVLTVPGHHIENSVANGRGQTTGTLIYEKELGDGEEFKRFEIKGNSVFIHTPALNGTKMEDVSAFDQRTAERKDSDVEKYAASRPISLPLDHVTELKLETRGRHINEKGYGMRDYEEHLKAKLIKLPFDAYISKSAYDIAGAKPDDTYFLLSGSLLRLEPNVKRVFVKAAPWVAEGLYHINTYMVAKNASDVINPETLANLHFNKDAASVDIAVLVSGRLFDFTVEKVLDPAYQSTDGRHFWDAGLETKDSRPKRRFLYRNEAYKAKWTLPLTAAKSPYKYRVGEAVKLGYPFIFSIKSMGTYYAKDDVILFKPRFWHIAKDGRVNSNIALYYKKNGSLVALGSKEDELKNYAIFRSFAGVDNQELIQDSQLLYGGRARTGTGEDGHVGFTELPSPGAYMSLISRPVFISKPSYALSSSAFRVFTAKALPRPPGVLRERSGMSLQKWYGSYQLPSSTVVYALDERGEVDFNKRITEGCIGLGFEIGLARANNEAGFDLAYVTDTYNGWKTQAYQAQRGLPEGLIILYSVDKSMHEDYVIK